jgi:hypothetical protein
MEKKKLAKIIIIIGIILLIAGPVLGFLVDKLTLVNATPITIQEDSDTDVQNAYAFPVSLAKNQKLTIEFSVYYEDIQATIKILGKGTYDANSNPNGLTGLSFIYSEFTWGQTPSTSAASATSRTITDDGYWYIEFSGTTSGDYLVYRPGDYVIIVYGTNGGSPTAVYFNITIKIDGPGVFLQNLFIAIGIIILVCYVLWYSYGYLNKLRRGLD